ncbi:cysteine dioxygenase family protein [Bradyrhizobium mercantei]|uniref:cysteine dioxygenase family protein n=1 Tax=Bradyrhizobium mercantei TaxID=1904807 RepID=UPI0009759714|nr:cysteine dioxygenase [Bradyrhizobium mercantei]
MDSKLKMFVGEVNSVLARCRTEDKLFECLQGPFRELISVDDWLSPRFAQPHHTYYQQYLLHADPEERFSIVSFVWGPGQKTPIHNHTVWGMIGVLRGAEIGIRYARPTPGMPMQAIGEERLEPGMIDFVSPTVGDIHAVRNAFDDRVSISVHVYGANIGKVAREVYDAATGVGKLFVSGFSNA